MRGCPEGLLDWERNFMKTARNRAETSVNSVSGALKWGSPRCVPGTQRKERCSTATEATPLFPFCPRAERGDPRRRASDTDLKLVSAPISCCFHRVTFPIQEPLRATAHAGES